MNSYNDTNSVFKKNQTHKLQNIWNVQLSNKRNKIARHMKYILCLHTFRQISNFSYKMILIPATFCMLVSLPNKVER